MLSGRDREILSRFEAELGSVPAWRMRLIAVARAILLLTAVVMLGVGVGFTASRRIPPGDGAFTVAVAGLVTGWQLLSHSRRYVLGPRMRRRYRGRTQRPLPLPLPRRRRAT